MLANVAGDWLETLPEVGSGISSSVMSFDEDAKPVVGSTVIIEFDWINSSLDLKIRRNDHTETRKLKLM